MAVYNRTAVSFDVDIEKLANDNPISVYLREKPAMTGEKSENHAKHCAFIYFACVGMMAIMAISGCKSKPPAVPAPPAITDEEAYFHACADYYRKRLSDKAPKVRMAAAIELRGSDGDRDTIDDLRKSLNDPATEVRYAAAVSLAGLGYMDDQVAVDLAGCFINGQRPGMKNGPDAFDVVGIFHRKDTALKAKAAVPLFIKAAQSDSDSQWRCYALRILGKIGSPDAVPALRATLHDRDESCRCTAARALAEIGPAAKDAVPELREIMKYPDVCAKLAGEALAKIGAVDVLIDEVKKRDTNRLEPAVLGLAFAKDHLDEVAQVLTAEMARGNYQAAESLLVLGDVARPALPEFLKLARNQGRIGWASQAVVAAKFAVKFGVTDQFLPIFIEQLGSEKGNEGVNAAVALGEMGQAAAPAAKALLKAFVTPNKYIAMGETNKTERYYAVERTRASAAYALGKIKSDDPDVVPALLAALDASEQSIREAAITSLVQYGPVAKDAVPLLIKMQQDKNNVTAVKAIQSLGRIGPAARDAVPALIQKIKDRHDEDEACAALVAIGPDAVAAVPVLFAEGLANWDRDRSQKTIAAFGKAAIPFLTQKLQGTQREQQFVVECMVQMENPDPSLLPTLLDLLGHKDKGMRVYAARALGKMGTNAADAVIPLRKLLADQDAGVQFEAATALRKIVKSMRADATKPTSHPTTASQLVPAPD